MAKRALRKIKLPKIHLNLSFLKALNTTQLLVTLLIVASFLIGVLVTKVQYLEKGNINPSAITVGNNGTAAQGNAANGAAPVGGTAAGAAAPAAPTTGVKVGVGDFPAKGSSDAKIKIIEFADFRCPFCEQFFSQTESQLIKEYVDTGKVQFYFRNFAFLGPASVTAADASECANDQGKFWDYHDYLYKNQPSESDTSMYNTDTLTQAAVSLGMNGDTFKSCLDNKTGEAKANKDLSDGQAAGVSGTPTFIINGTVLVGAQPYASIKSTIDSELAK